MANFSVAAVFSDHMVLQRDKNINIFGTCKDSALITVSFRGTSVTADCANGRWRAVLPPCSAGTGFVLSVRCGDEKIEFSDVAVGEVWLAGGQSNMELELQNCKEWPEVCQLPADNLLRFYYTQKKGHIDDEFLAREAQTEWTTAGSDAMRFWSAVGYFFSARLRAELDVPVGIIGCNWGGSSASAWLDIDTLTADRDTNSYVLDYLEAIDGKSEEEQISEYTEYAAYQEQFDRRMADFLAAHPDMKQEDALPFVGENKWPGPMGCINPYRPAGLYECMLSRVAPYSLRGFIFYQGESDEHKPTVYYKLFTDMISCWRRYWEDDTLPFICVQLPMHRYKGDPDRKQWPLIREAQMKTFQTIKNTGIAVAVDQGEWNEIHPKAKRIVGQRLALQALHGVYQMLDAADAFGPIFSSCTADGNMLHLYFDHADNGFICRGDNVCGFEIAGADCCYIPAKAVISGSSIDVYADGLEQPRYARYLWTNYADVCIFGKNGIPLAPFRTSTNDQSETEVILS